MTLAQDKKLFLSLGVESGCAMAQTARAWIGYLRPRVLVCGDEIEGMMKVVAAAAAALALIASSTSAQ